uniref:Uncharacterized protein n=1 Tax=Sphaerodactylus townsendi TaxID=933632 RepID=A0ACB8FHI1_9SAUR
MNRGSSAASCPPSLPADGQDSLGHSERRRVCSNCRKVLRQLSCPWKQESLKGVRASIKGWITLLSCLMCAS